MVNIPKQSGSRSQRFRDRLFSRTRKLRTGCVVYMGCVHPDGGYGSISFEGRRYQTHRASWEIAHGPIPEGMIVRHACDVPSCVNVAHLRLGRTVDNIRDKVMRGRARGATGPANANCKLSTEQVAQIRATYVPGTRKGSGTSVSDLALQFGITPQYVNQLGRGLHRRVR
jgi:hypothetical protein